MRNLKKLWLSVIALIACAFLAKAVLPEPYGPSPLIAWQLASLKLSGTVPEITWVDIVRDFIGWPQWPYFAREFITGDVRLKSRSNFPGCPYVLDTPVGDIHGRFTDVELVEGILKEILQQHIYEHPQARVRPGDVVLDVGAHLGTFARYAFQKGASVVIGVEPDPRNVACLKQTFHEEIRQGKFRLVEAAASDSEGTITLFQHPDSSMSRVVERNLRDWETRVFRPWKKLGAEPRSIPVPARTLDSMIAHLVVERVDFIKMDIEGAERLALAGARQILERFAPRMVLCIYHREDDPVVLPRLARQLQPRYRTATTKTQAFFFE
ncbi:MAG TPA: FkbM family methyltransferase [Bryobacteraceae bacterium]|nr:FkbM family methyltransferase [Bryobacteraceae bacterium]